MEAFDEDGSFGYDIVFPIICVNDLPLSESTSASDSEESDYNIPNFIYSSRNSKRKTKNICSTNITGSRGVTIQLQIASLPLKVRLKLK
eukprot:CAMPEP_0114578442 /NCGR_PEP_ID=MMETSP0125-20121206/2977_1 /TAXON_ID=485358 ORGANISM="Aristerostoma sp., Strain ATCC 50986" /NCGR_SAMPLE_ID=MMETSP0125 /ASSEMBLY_ACC=CAM_ASM_000245 /LENGTH=88 /DNA_ID=CAMNT_0001768507 /DNA_START=738 /DNA_END=1002 /DNA_ORIENTATION=+